ncbi:hypothetical protein GCM10023191_098730 [Actinoallomurus oryzae]|uniref:Uncharacterized protein n=1 Tax=Actinoallomurus oryzae TaxID=502180 RepID=A0ABP8R8K5_9ACTN
MHPGQAFLVWCRMQKICRRKRSDGFGIAIRRVPVRLIFAEPIGATQEVRNQACRPALADHAQRAFNGRICGVPRPGRAGPATGEHLARSIAVASDEGSGTGRRDRADFE